MENKYDKFKRLAELRVNNCLKNIQLIGNLSNKNSYEYTEEEVKKIFKVIKQEISKAENKFSNSKRKFKI